MMDSFVPSTEPVAEKIVTTSGALLLASLSHSISVF